MSVRELFENTKSGLVVHVHVQPGAGRSAIVGTHGTALKVRVAAPPVDGRANEAVGELLAQALGVKPAEVTLVAGDKSRAKRFRVNGLDAEELEERLDVVLRGAGAGPPGGRRRHD